MKTFFILTVLISAVNGDCYMHNPRGSNNRLDEQGRARNNANRLFDSQNNNRGGHNVGSVYFYAGSRLPIEWTNQHSCNNANNHCELIFQYMCQDNVRDGATTTTIPENLMMCEDNDCNTDTRFGMHENYDYYLKCKLRERNMGLFVADQNLNSHRNRAKNTRQNPNGNRRAYECPEERDYYPYWHPTPWKDIAVLTNDATRCPYYERESENVKSRWECVIDRSILIHNSNKGLLIPNNQEDCENFRWPENDANGTRGVWTEVASHGLAAPLCREPEHTRDNHLGNTFGGYPSTLNWTVPDEIHERCVLRIRYNISTEDYDAWSVNASHNKQRNQDAANLPLAEKYGFDTEAEAAERGWEFKNNPEVAIFPGVDMKLRLAINTAQYGRTFQDRSHTFAIRKRPEELVGKNIHNVNVRGKRGNIVQVYPAVEYDFVPNTLEAMLNDYVHFQWTGSNTNPNNNDGQGRQGTDRSNVVLQRAQAYEEGTGAAYEPGSKFGHWGRSYPEWVSNTTFAGLSKEDLMHLALLTPGQFRGEMSELDDAGTYFDLGPRKVTRRGVFHYMSTRNNNFSNRSQKGRLIVKDAIASHEPIGWNGGNLTLNSGKANIQVEQGTFGTLQKIVLQEWSAEEGEKRAEDLGREIKLGDGYASPFIVIEPEEKLAVSDKTFQVEMKVSSGSTSDVNIYRTESSSFSTWTRVNADIKGSVASFEAQNGGVYVAISHDNTAVIAGAVIGTLVIVALLVGGTFYYCRKNPGTMSSIRRSMQSKV